MNCEEVQQEILGRLAEGESFLPDPLMAHRQSCAGCRTYYEEQVALFRSIDQGLRGIANAPVPPSLLPAVRARLGEQPASRPFRLSGWPLTALAAASAAIVLGWMLFLRQAARPGIATPEVAKVTVQDSTPESKRDAAVVNVAPKHGQAARRPVNRLASLPADVSHKEPAPEVIVLAEEREAFARFIAQVPENPAAAVALTRRMPEESGSVVEIALLTIKPVEVKPLESSEE